jgi:UMF1 family MFS transporter
MTTDEPGPAAGAETAPPVTPASFREIFGWCMFDFANSSYTTLMLTFSFPIYFREVVVAAAGMEGMKDSLWGLSVSISQAIVLFTAPVVGAIADYSGAKKRFLGFTYAGCIAGTAALAALSPANLIPCMAAFVFATVCFSSGENIVAAFLPEIASPEKMGRISGLGWALGYLGGLGSLFACMPFLLPGIDAEHAGGVRLSFVAVALFFLLGGLPTFLFLRERAVPRPLPPGRGYVGVGISRTLETLARVRRYRQLFRFLGVFLLYTCGINIVVVFANVFAKEAMGMSMKELLIFFCILQLSASIGAFAFGMLQDRLGAKVAIQLSLVLWIAACLGAYWTTSLGLFYVVGNLAGMAMGAAQSGGRALVGTFSPVSRSGEFFGFWGLSWKLSGVIGPLVFGLTSDALGMRPAILVTTGFFVLGLIAMSFIDEEEGRRAATVQQPGAS